jgi:hypothetical protein
MEAIIDDGLTLARQGKAITETEVLDLADVAETAWEHVDTAVRRPHRDHVPDRRRRP